MCNFQFGQSRLAFFPMWIPRSLTSIIQSKVTVELDLINLHIFFFTNLYYVTLQITKNRRKLLQIRIMFLEIFADSLKSFEFIVRSDTISFCRCTGPEVSGGTDVVSMLTIDQPIRDNREPIFKLS